MKNWQRPFSCLYIEEITIKMFLFEKYQNTKWSWSIASSDLEEDLSRSQDQLWVRRNLLVDGLDGEVLHDLGNDHLLLILGKFLANAIPGAVLMKRLRSESPKQMNQRKKEKKDVLTQLRTECIGRDPSPLIHWPTFLG